MDYARIIFGIIWANLLPSRGGRGLGGGRGTGRCLFEGGAYLSNYGMCAVVTMQCRRIFGAWALNNPSLLPSWAKEARGGWSESKVAPWGRMTGWLVHIREINLLFSANPWKTPALQATHITVIGPSQYLPRAASLGKPAGSPLWRALRRASFIGIWSHGWSYWPWLLVGKGYLRSGLFLFCFVLFFLDGKGAKKQKGSWWQVRERRIVPCTGPCCHRRNGRR